MVQIVRTTLHDGPRNAAVHVAIEGTGEGDLDKVALVDPTNFDPPMAAEPSLTLTKLWYNLVGFDAKLAFDDLVSDTLVWTMTGDEYKEVCFDIIGGLSDRSSQDGDGRLKITTVGLGAGDFGSMIAWLKKD